MPFAHEIWEQFGSYVTLETNIITSDELAGSDWDENDDQKEEWEIVTRQPVFVSTDPTTCWLGKSENADAHVIWNVSLILQSVFIRIGGLIKWTECFQSRHVSNCHRPSVLSHLPAFLSFSLYFITYWLTSWVLQVHKSPSFKRLLGFWVCRLRVLEKIWYLNHSNKELHLPSASYARRVKHQKIVSLWWNRFKSSANTL